MLLAWPEKAKNQYRDLRVFSHRSRVPPQANKFLFIDISDVNPLVPASVHTSLCLPPRGSGSKRKRTIRPRLGYDTFLGSIWNAGKNGAWIPYQPADDDGERGAASPYRDLYGAEAAHGEDCFWPLSACRAYSARTARNWFKKSEKPSLPVTHSPSRETISMRRAGLITRSVASASATQDTDAIPNLNAR